MRRQEPHDLSELVLERAPRSLRVFTRYIAWPVVEPGRPFRHNWHIDAMCEHLEAVTNGDITRLLINVPPRTAKSTIVSVAWPAWEWLLNPQIRWLFTSYAQQLSTRDSVKCRRIIEAPIYQQVLANLYGRDRWQLTGDSNLKMRYENTRMGLRLATSFTGAATGEGGDRVVADDPHNASEAESDTVRANTVELWGSTFSTRLNDPDTGAMVVVMQRLHEADLSGKLLEEGGWTHLCLPMQYEAKHPFAWPLDPRRPDLPATTGVEQGEGALLHPSRIPLEAVPRVAPAMGSNTAAGQLQQRPAPAEGGIFKRAWWRYYVTPEWHAAHGLPDDVPTVVAPPWSQMHEMLESWDCAFKDHDDADYVVGQVWARHGSFKYLCAQVRDRMTFTETLHAVRRLSQQWPDAYLKLIEDKANGTAVIDTLRGEVSGVLAVEPEGGKVARAQAVAPQVEAGEVFLPHPAMAPWVDGYVNEHASFPNAANDDQVDASSQGLRRLAGGGEDGETGPDLWE